MDYDGLINTILASSTEDWNMIAEGFEPETHDYIASYKPDVSIALAWSKTIHDDFKEDWAKGFPDPQASSHYVDILYNNSLVERFVYVAVDGFRAYLPLPKRDDLTVPNKYSDFIRLLNNIARPVDNYDDYFHRAKLQIVDTKWP
jgi:hypothetical protein